MDTDAEMKERHARLLGRYAEQAAMLADDLCTAALAAQDAQEKQALSLAFHRMGRTLRQTLALEARLRRDARLEARAEDDRAEAAAKSKAEARKARVRHTVTRLIWDEAEDDEQADYLQLLNERLESEDLADPEEPIETLIDRIAEDLGLQAESDELPSSPCEGGNAPSRASDAGQWGRESQQDSPQCRPPIGLGAPVPGEAEPDPSG